jgi:hypothetical protein
MWHNGGLPLRYGVCALAVSMKDAKVVAGINAHGYGNKLVVICKYVCRGSLRN